MDKLARGVKHSSQRPLAPPIQIPNQWRPRPKQMRLWHYLEQGGKRAVYSWHRRYGKDSTALNWTATQVVQKPAVYWHLLPEASQARKAIWRGINPKTGQRLIDQVFPHEIRAVTRDQEMSIEFKNGALWQVVGSDNFNSLVGSPPLGVVFSEYALSDPAAWALIRPILLENGGWAIFESTPRGRNHFAALIEKARDWPDWFSEVLTVDDTGHFTPDQLAQEHRELIAENGEEWGESMFRQEYYCSFDAAIRGAYYGKLMEAADNDGRIGDVPYDPRHPVVTSWDLGMGDHTVIWCAQMVGSAVHVIDCVAGSGVGLDWYVKELRAKPYVYKEHIVPHDIAVRELGTGVSRQDTLESLGCRPLRIAAKLSVDDGINALRNLIPRMRFDRTKCARLIEALRVYRASYDEVLRTLRPTPLHDWASHFADAGRYLAVGLREQPAGIAGPTVLPRRRMAA